MPEPPIDQAARDTAIDIARSVIVQAPAGSGKTDLLTRRFLKLLAVVDQPEDILAITFTRAATAEMRTRILSDLDAAAGRRSFAPDELPRIVLARDALAQSDRRGWDLLNHPERLAVDTIDSLSLRIAHDRPLLARLGGRLQPTEEAGPLYAIAARRTLDRLGGANAELDAALAHFLDLRDNRLADCEDLLGKMLATRDQWQHALPLSRAMTEDDWADARVNLEAPFRREIARVLGAAHQLLSEESTLASELLALANFACANGNQGVAGLAGIADLSPSFSIEHWLCLCNLVLTKDGDWRKRVQSPEGFPTEKAGGPAAKRTKEKMEFLLARLRNLPQLLAALRAIRGLPPTSYSDSQWLTLRHVFTVLRHAVGELRVVFAEQNAVDFTELSLAAIHVLQEAPDRAIARHLLIDEFQDTSRRQHELLTAILRAWDPGSDPSDHRTVFLVGDPMQSIYMFRQAEVELFTHAWTHGLGPEDARVPCDPVSLSVNFRSHAGVTAPLNEFFTAICAQDPPPGSAAATFAPATAHVIAPDPASTYVHVHPLFIGNGNGRPTREESAAARSEEAQEILDILERTRADHPEYRIAVLVRARPHLAELVPLLRDRAIAFRAVEIDRLSDRQELLDLRSLTRALLHPMDRIAWLAILRAPWCGLTLADLHILAGSDDPACKTLSALELIDRNQHRLSPDGRERLARTAQILRRALQLRWRQSESPSFASWIERTWRTLGGPAALDAAALENCEVFFTLLDAVTPDGLAPLTADFDAQLDRLFAQPDPSGGIELMTIHKAKGLGFDVVIVPGLERKPRREDQPLIAALERRDPFNPAEDEFLVAPIGAKGDDSDPLYQWVAAQRKLRVDEERKRLFYVACTRARTELHLFGTATVSSSGLRPGDASSLLATAWPALAPEFEALYQKPVAAAAVPPNVIVFPAPGEVAALAAVAEPAPSHGPFRLPLDYRPVPAANVTVTGANILGRSDPPEFRRPKGSRSARVVGAAVHALLERLGAGLIDLAAEQLRAHAASLLRAAALTGDAMENATVSVTNLILACAADPICRWILAPHPEAQSEASWSGFADARLRTLRTDRVFRAGPAPLAEGYDCLWIVDYKTGTAPSTDSAAWIAAERQTYAPQLLAYGRALRAIHGAQTQLRLGLYYPAISVLDWWEPSGS
jgi:ATP-dependent helicase/nuclease subunit A